MSEREKIIPNITTSDYERVMTPPTALRPKHK